jgi:hypothetical protein
VRHIAAIPSLRQELMMLNKSNEAHWQAIRESYKGAIVFYEDAGIFIVRGEDAQLVSKAFRIQSNGAWLGFEASEARLYMRQLVRLGYQVIHAWEGHAVFVTLKETRPVDLRRERTNSTSLAVEPELLFDKGELDVHKNEAWVRKYRYEDLLAQFVTWLRGGDWKSVRGYGQIFIYKVSDWYEFDRELTTMPPQHIRVLVTASLITHRKFPCRLVTPKGRRRVRSMDSIDKPTGGQTQTRFGQLRFDDL